MGFDRSGLRLAGHLGAVLATGGIALWTLQRSDSAILSLLAIVATMAAVA